jgi:hypothetical protein
VDAKKVLWTEGEEWLEAIKLEIKEKYKFVNPKFMLNGTIKTYDKIAKWCDYMIQVKRFVKYKKLSKNVFELKSFFPDPSDEICKKIIQETFVWDGFFCGLEKDDFLFESWYCDTFYSFSQIKREALFALKIGYSELHLLGLNKASNLINLNKKKLEMMPYKTEVGVMLEDGYLKLEYRD